MSNNEFHEFQLQLFIVMNCKKQRYNVKASWDWFFWENPKISLLWPRGPLPRLTPCLLRFKVVGHRRSEFLCKASGETAFTCVFSAGDTSRGRYISICTEKKEHSFGWICLLHQSVVRLTLGSRQSVAALRNSHRLTTQLADPPFSSVRPNDDNEKNEDEKLWRWRILI